GRVRLAHGKGVEGTRTLERLIATSPQWAAADFVRLGEAEHELEQFQQANADFRQASGLAPGDVAMNIGWGELFAAKYNRSDAAKSFDAALMAAPDNVRAKIDMAGLMVATNPPPARETHGGALMLKSHSVPRDLL